MNTHNSSAETISNNSDLLTQILLKLLVKPLLRFKSVSKQWLSLISSPHFSSLHSVKNPTQSLSGLLLRSSVFDCKFLNLNSSSLHSLPFFNNYKVLQSCNGLLLCSTFPKVGIKRAYYIVNPTTKCVFQLPSLSHTGNATVFGLNLAFDPFKSCNYSVICVRSTSVSIYHYQIEIYESKIGSWRLSGSPFVAPFDMVFDNGVFWNGGIHWISPTGNTLCINVDQECIFNFPKPPFSGGWGKRRFRYFNGCGGHLILIETYGSCALSFNVYELDNDYSAWSVRYHVELDSLVVAYPEIVRKYLDAGDSNYYAFVVLSVNEKEDKNESSLLIHIPGKIISYKFNDKTLKEVCELGYGDGSKSRNALQFGWLDAYQYIETLACV